MSYLILIFPLLCLILKQKKSYQLKGKTEYMQEGKKYQDVFNWVQEKRPDLHPKGALYVTIEEIFSGARKIA